MKKIFTLAMAACLGMYANAQDTSGWKDGQEVTSEINWKAYDAADEDPANPVWQGFQYGTPGDWEFRAPGEEQITSLQTADANNHAYFMCWGAYNLPPVDVYQEFTMPAGVYTVTVQGAYRHGQDDVTLKMWAAGEKTENCFVYVTVGDDNYQTPMRYKFDGKATEALGAKFDNNDWGNEKKYNYVKDGVTYDVWSPQSHCAADWYIENEYFKGNDVQFVVPEDGMTVRVGIKKPVAIAQDQIWWNHWRMFYDMPYGEDAKVLVATTQAKAMLEEVKATVVKTEDKYPGPAALMGDDVIELEDALDAAKTLDEVNQVIADIEAVTVKHKNLLEKAAVLDKTYDICLGMFQLTDYPGKAALEAVMDKSKTLLYDEELDKDTEIQSYVDAADELVKARMIYLESQEYDPADNSKDFTHALAFPYWVNQENTGWYSPESGYYEYPQNVVDALNAVNDGGDSNLEIGWGNKDGDVSMEAVSSKAGWSNKADAENTWIYIDNWNGWHGGMKACIQKLKGYAGFNSDWSQGADTSKGGMEVFQNLKHLPDGFYTLEGNVWHNDQVDDPFKSDYNYMFVEDGEGNQIAKVCQETESRGYWDGWDKSHWTHLKSDFFELKGGKARVGYFNTCWSMNSIMVLKYYSEKVDFSGILQKKLDEIPELEEGYLWPGDLATYKAKLAKIVFPIADKEAYNEAIEILNDAIAFKNYAHGVTSSFNVPQQYLDLEKEYEDMEEVLDVAWGAVMSLGDGKNDTAAEAEVATAIYNKYVEYLAARAEAIADYNDEAMQALIDAQVADLKANYASVATLEKYMSEIATQKNAFIFNELCGNASEANPADITAKYVKNASLDEGTKTGWTLVVADPSCNTYGRQLAECWNQQPFEISQTLYAMPAGTYELSVRACYRAGGDVNQSMIDATKDGSFPYNAQLFMNASEVKVASVCENGEGGIGWTDPSFEVWYDGTEAADALKAEGFVADWDNTVCVKEGEEWTKIAAWENDEDHMDDFYSIVKKEVWQYNEDGEKTGATNGYPFDTNINGVFYPCSMIGFQERIMKSENAYVNKVQLYLPEPGTIKFGLKKTAAIGNDWLIYDDFKLKYLGAAETEQAKADGIETVNAEGAAKAIYNVAGQRINALQKGINIVGGKKIFVK